MKPSTLRDLTVLAVGVIGAIAVALTGARNPAHGVLLAGYLSASIALAGGLGYAVTPPSRAQSVRSRAFLGVGVALSSISVMFGATGGPTATKYHPWDVVVVGCTFALIVAAMLRPLAPILWVSSLRVALEAVVIASGVSTMIWTVFFLDWQMSPADSRSVASVLVVGVFLVSVAVLNLARGVDPWWCLAHFSAAGLVGSYLFTTLRYLDAGDGGWLGYSLSCFFWSLVIISLFRAENAPVLDQVGAQARVEWRVMVIVGVTLPIVVTVAGLTLVQGARPDEIAWTLLVVFVVSLFGRELVRAWYSHSVLTRLARQARLDGLTQLPNRRSLDERLDLLRSRYSGPLTVLTIDIDRFKDVNDLLGRAAGDSLLRVLAGRLNELADDNDAEVYRTAGDEFVLLALGAGRGAALADRVTELVAQLPQEVPSLEAMPVHSSVGVAEGHVDVDEAEAQERVLITQSGQAMRQAKRGHGGTAIFDAALAQRQRRSRQIEERLREQLAGNLEVEVHFQPVVALSRRALVGAEALARWDGGQGLGVVSPADFIPIAEEHGLMERLGEQLLEASLRGAVNSGLIARGLWVGVNVSPLQLRVGTFVPRLLALLTEHGVPPTQFVVEVTESVFMRADDPAVGNLAALHDAGVGVSLDDFGTGYSSLAYLTRLPVSGLKVDRSITMALDNPKTAAIAASIAEMARRLDLEVIVEGIETVRQERQLRALGFDFVQGLLYSGAVPVPELMARMRRYDEIEAGAPLGELTNHHKVDGAGKRSSAGYLHDHLGAHLGDYLTHNDNVNEHHEERLGLLSVTVGAYADRHTSEADPGEELDDRREHDAPN